MSRRAFLHVGSPKTGTTRLQNLMWGSRDRLAAAGVELPLERVDHYRLAELLRSEALPRTPGRDADGTLAAAPLVGRLREALAAGGSDVVISHELLAHARDERVAELLDELGGFEVHVVLTVRDYQRQIPSEWQQFVKTQHIATFGNFLNRLHVNPEHRFWDGQDYAAVLARWGRDLDPDRVHVVTVPPSGAGADVLVERFFGVLGVDPDGLTAADGYDNAALGLEQAELLRLVNRRLPQEFLDRRRLYAAHVKEWLAESVLARQSGTRIVLPPEQVAWCTELAEAQIDRLTGAGYDVVGSLSDLLPRPEASRPFARPRDAELVDAAVSALAEIVLGRAEEAEQVARLDRRVAELEQALAAAQATRQAGEPARRRQRLFRR